MSAEKRNHDGAAEPRTGKDLFRATAPYARESRAESWRQVGGTFVLLAAAMVAAGTMPAWQIRLPFSVLAGLLLVRCFIFYHDYMHGTILSDSRAAWWLFRIFSAVALTPPRSWKKSHNYHHGHVGRLASLSTGAFPLMTVRQWRAATPAARLAYRIQRHPLTILFGYLTIFLFSVTLQPLFREPRRHWDSALVLGTHVGLAAGLWMLGGIQAAVFVLVLPVALASALGGYLFFAQHSFPDMKVFTEEEWSPQKAALEASSYMRLSLPMAWFTGNIGYHHIHHLNVRIPFYRLPEAMAAVPELQHPRTTSLSLRDIRDCFRSCLWDEEGRRMVSFAEAG